MNLPSNCSMLLITKEHGGHEYNLKTGKIEVNRFAMSLPNIYYKVEF